MMVRFAQLNVEPLFAIAHLVCYSQHTSALSFLSKSILLICLNSSFLSNVIINGNCHEYDFSMEFSLPHCNKPFHFCSKDMFLLINF